MLVYILFSSKNPTKTPRPCKNKQHPHRLHAPRRTHSTTNAHGGFPTTRPQSGAARSHDTSRVCGSLIVWFPAAFHPVYNQSVCACCLLACLLHSPEAAARSFFVASAYIWRHIWPVDRSSSVSSPLRFVAFSLRLMHPWWSGCFQLCLRGSVLDRPSTHSSQNTFFRHFLTLYTVCQVSSRRCQA